MIGTTAEAFLPPMASSMRIRFRDPETGEDPMADEVETEGSSGLSSDGGYDSELESMTGKGIKHLCSELLELKKTSDEDFQRNVYSNYSTFIRIFEEAGSVETDLMELKQHVLTQRKLVSDLINSFNLEILSDSMVNEAEGTEDLDSCSPDRFGTDMYGTLDTLDILLSEKQLEEALIVLEVENKTLQEIGKEDLLSPVIMSYISAISDRRDRIIEQFACLAGHPRVAEPELQKALSGLCRLGESQQANFLLLKHYHSHLANYMKELECSERDLHAMNIRELAKIVFSVISQAARSFVMLHGEVSPCTSELMQWAGEEIKMFNDKFDKYLRSISELSGGLYLAVDAVNTAFSLSSSLKTRGVFLQPDLMKLIRPCVEEVLQMHVNRFRNVVRIWTTTDTWVLGKFFLPGKLRNKTSLADIEYCLLSSSGRKFITLMQVIVDDTSSLVNLQMESPILQGLADLFNEYMHALQRAIPDRENAVENGFQIISSAHALTQQLSLLVNSMNLVDLFSVIAASVYEDTKPLNNVPFLELAGHSSWKELDALILSVQEAADQLWCYFCHQFVSEVMSTGQHESTPSLESCAHGQWVPSLKEDQMPSFAFQALFQRLRQLEDLSKSIFIGKDGLVHKLLKDLMEAVIVWLSNNQEFWENTEKCPDTQKLSFVEQVRLDIHFLVEIAQLKGYCSVDLMATAMNIIAQLSGTSAALESDSNSAVPDDRWTSNAAKLAIEKLLAVQDAEPQPKEEVATIFPEYLSAQKYEDTRQSDGDDGIGSLEDSADHLDGEFDGFAEEDITKLHRNESLEFKPHERLVDLNDEDSRGNKNEDDATGNSEDTADKLDGEFSGLAEEEKIKLLQNKNSESKPFEVPTSDSGIVDLDDEGSRGHKNGDDATGTSEDSTDLLDGQFNDMAEEDITNMLVDKSFESKFVESSTNDISIVDSDDANCLGPAIQHVDMEDEQETNGIIEPDKSRGLDDTEKPDDDSMIIHEVDSVEKLDDCVAVLSQSVTDKLKDVAELEDLGAQSKFLEVPDKLEAAMACLSDSAGTAIVVDIKEIELYPENRPAVLQSGDTGSSIHKGDTSYSATLEDLIQADLQRSADEKNAGQILDYEKELPAEKAEEVVLLDKSSETEGRDASLVADNGSSYRDLVQLRGRTGWSRNIKPLDNLKRNRNDSRTPRPRWQ